MARPRPTGRSFCGDARPRYRVGLQQNLTGPSSSKDVRHRDGEIRNDIFAVSNPDGLIVIKTSAPSTSQRQHPAPRASVETVASIAPAHLPGQSALGELPADLSRLRT